jgi:hypothetical protein
MMSKALLDYIGLEVGEKNSIRNDYAPYLAFTVAGTKVYRDDDTLLQWEHINGNEAEEWGLGQGDILLVANVSLYFLALTLKGI